MIETGACLEKFWKTASKSKSITKCVLVYVVPSINWQKAADLAAGGDCLKGATADFQSECVVCAIQIFQNSRNLEVRKKAQRLPAH